MLLRHDDRHTMGHFPEDWDSAMQQRCQTWDERCKHVVRAPSNRSAANSQREPGHVVLRERLIAHFAHASAKGEVSWLQTMAKARPRVGWEEAEQCAGLLDEDDEESDGESEIESESDGEDE